MNSVIKKINYFLFFILLLFVILNLNNFKDLKFALLLLLPLFYLMLSIFEEKFYHKYTLILWMLQFFLFFKFFLTPLLLINSQDISVLGPAPKDENFTLAIFLMTYEMIAIFFIKRYFIIHKQKPFKKRPFVVTGLHVKAFLVISLLLFFYIFRKDILMPKDIFNPFEDSNAEELAKDSLELIVKWMKIISFPILSLSLVQIAKLKNKSTVAYLLSGVLLVLFAYLQVGTSRWIIVFYFIASLNYMFRIFGAKVKKIAYPFIIFGIFIFLSISIFKFSWQVDNSAAENKYLAVVEILSNQFQAYFSGPSLVTQGLDMNEQSWFQDKISYDTLVNDFMGSIPFLAENFDQHNRINYFFNEYIFGLNTSNVSQIMPMSVIGYSYFGFILSPVFIILSIFLAFSFEQISLRERDPILTYLYLYMALWSVVCICFSTQIVWGNLITTFIPLIIVIKLINIISK